MAPFDRPHMSFYLSSNTLLYGQVIKKSPVSETDGNRQLVAESGDDMDDLEEVSKY